MRWVLGLVVTVMVLWMGYWFAGSTMIARQVDRVFAETPGLEKTASGVGGFPYRFDLTVQGLKASDPVSGAGYEADMVQLLAMTWKPWHLILALPEASVIRLAGQEIGLTGTGLKASVRAAPAMALPLAEARVAGQGIGLVSSLGWDIGAADLTLALAKAETGEADYALGITAEGVRVDPAFRTRLAAIALPNLPLSDLPEEAGPVRANILLHLSAPLDRHLGETRPRLTGLDIGEFQVTWGEMVLSATGNLRTDAQGFAEGEIVLSVLNWDRLPPLLVATGVVKPEIAPTLAGLMRAMAGEAGDPTLLRLPLNLAEGQMSFGPFPLGPAPMLGSPSG